MSDHLADRPPRPLADAPLAALSAAAGELAHEWLVELVAARPLSELGSLDLAASAAEAPALCEAIVAALGGDEELDELRLAGGHARSIASACAAAADPAYGPGPGIELLRRVIWSAALAELRRPPADLVAALSDRLAHVCAVVALTAQGSAVPGRRREFVLHDVRSAPPPPVTEEDARWDDQLEAELAGRGPGSLLLLDVDGHERLMAADGAAALSRADKALRRRLGEASLVRERLGRYWVVSACANDLDAHRLGARLADAVTGGAGHLGVPLTASVGFALHDGIDGAEVAQAVRDRAEEAMLSARAAGIGVDSR